LALDVPFLEVGLFGMKNCERERELLGKISSLWMK
jgi:hypothetical protein